MSNAVAQTELFGVKIAAPAERALDLGITAIDDLTARYPWAALTMNLIAVETLVTITAR